MVKGLDFIGDIHGCREELHALLNTLGYEKNKGTFTHPNKRKLVFIGDLTDRGPDSVNVMTDVSGLIDANIAYYIPGNHCDKLYRYFRGRPVQIRHGLETTVAELHALTEPAYQRIRRTFMRLFEKAPLYIMLYNDEVVAAHAGIRRSDIGKSDKSIRSFVLYGDVDHNNQRPGERPKRRDWVLKEHDDYPWIVYGHTPVRTPRVFRRTINIDTGCVFGGALTAFRYPELTTVAVPSRQPEQPDKFRVFKQAEPLSIYRSY